MWENYECNSFLIFSIICALDNNNSLSTMVEKNIGNKNKFSYNKQLKWFLKI